MAEIRLTRGTLLAIMSVFTVGIGVPYEIKIGVGIIGCKSCLQLFKRPHYSSETSTSSKIICGMESPTMRSRKEEERSNSAAESASAISERSSGAM